MQAVVINRYGDAAQLIIADIEKPEPDNHEILVKVMAASINPVDWKIRRGDIRLLTGNKFPRVLGVDFSGVVEKVGSAVSNYGPGDAVFGLSNPLGTRYGTYAQYALTQEDAIARKPEGLSFDDAASIPVAGLTAFKSLSEIIGLQSGQNVLVHGASGGVGSFAVQIAKALNISVYATCGESNIDFVNQLGADVTYDYRKQNVADIAERFDGILDASAKLDFSKVKHLLTGTGTYVSTVPTAENVLATIATSILSGRKCRLVLASGGGQSPRQLAAVAEMIVSGKVRAIIQKTIELSDVPETHRLAEQGHNRGKIVIRIAGS